MANIGLFDDNHKSHFGLTLAGLVLATGGILLREPLLSLSRTSPHEIFIIVTVYTYLGSLVPLGFYLNMLSLVLHVMALDGPQEAGSLSFYLKRSLPQASHTISLATLVVSMPLSVHAAIAKERVGLAVGAALICLVMVAILASTFKKFFISACTMPVLVTMFISTGFLTSQFSDKYYYHDHLIHHIPIHLALLSFVSFFVFMLSMILVILQIGAPAVIHGKNLVIGALSMASAALLVGWYMKAYLEVTGMVTELCCSYNCASPPKS